MSWNEAVITNAGLELLAECFTNGNVMITSVKGGESCSEPISLLAQKEIAEPVHDLNLGEAKTADGKINVKVRIQNKNLQKEYTVRQIGLFAKNSKNGSDKDSEILFAVIQDKTGEVIPKESDNPEFLIEFDFVIPVSNGESVNVQVTPNTFATVEDLLERDKALALHSGDKANPHSVTKAQVGLGNVPDVATNDQTPTYSTASELTEMKSEEKLSTAFGKIAKAVSEFIRHLADNVRHITANERANWNKKTTTAFSRSLSGGTKIGTITIDGAATDLYCQTNTDTHHTSATVTAGTATGNANSANVLTNGNVYLNHIENGAVRSSHRIIGSGAATVTADANGNVTVNSTNTTYTNMKGASASANGAAGLVPAPAKGNQVQYLRGDGTWQTPTNTTYAAATQSANGLMTAADKKKLDGIAAGANAYAHPTSSGNKHIPAGGASGQILRWGADGTAVWGADNNTTYGMASQSANGIMSAADKKKLDGIAAGANVNTVTGIKGNAESAYRTGNVNITPANIGAAESNHSHAYLPLAGGNMTGTVNTSKTTTTFLAGNQGQAIVNSTAGAGAYTMLDKLNSTNGYFTDGVYQGKRLFQYTAKATVDAGTNNVTKSVTLLDEAGNSAFPGTVSAAAFSGNAASATKATQDSAGQQINKTYIKALAVNGKTITYTKGDGSTGTITTQDTNTTYETMKGASASANGAAGLVPAPTKGNQGKYLRADGTWQTPPDTNTVYTHPVTSGNKHIPAGGASGQILRWSADGTAVWGNDNNTTYSNMGAASASAAGKAGLVPAPAAGAQGKFLRGDGTWQTPPDTNTVYTHPTTSGHKHIPAGGASGQILRWSADGTAVWGNDNNTTYSNMGAASASAAGKAGLVPAPAAGAQGKFLRGDGTWHTPANTTYSVATQSANGLMSAADKKKLDGMSGGANNIKIGSVTVVGKTGGTFKITNSGSYTKCFLMFFKGTDEFYAFGTVDFKAPSGSMITIENICMKNPVSLQVQSRSSSEITLYAYQTISTSTDTVNLTYMAILF